MALILHQGILNTRCNRGRANNEESEGGGWSVAEVEVLKETAAAAAARHGAVRPNINTHIPGVVKTVLK